MTSKLRDNGTAGHGHAIREDFFARRYSVVPCNVVLGVKLVGCLAYCITAWKSYILTHCSSPAFARDSLMVLDVHEAFYVSWYTLDRINLYIESRRVDRNSIGVHGLVVLRTFSFGSVISKSDKEVTRSRADFRCRKDVVQLTKNDSRVDHK